MSSTLALAALELFVHLDASEVPEDLVAIPADIPAALQIARIKPAQLPADWRHYPAPQSLADIGTRWAREGKTAILAVPYVYTVIAVSATATFSRAMFAGCAKLSHPQRPRCRARLPAGAARRLSLLHVAAEEIDRQVDSRLLDRVGGVGAVRAADGEEIAVHGVVVRDPLRLLPLLP